MIRLSVRLRGSPGRLRWMVNRPAAGSKAIKPRGVPIHSRPRRSSASAVTVFPPGPDGESLPERYRENDPVAGSYRLRPASVPIHIRPRLSLKRAVIALCESVSGRSGSLRKTRNSWPSKRSSPSRVPNQRNPSPSWTMAVTELWDRPSSSAYRSKRTGPPKDGAVPA